MKTSFPALGGLSSGLLGAAGMPVPPAYAGARSGVFDGYCRYNWTPANSRIWRESLGQVEAVVGSAEIAIIGDSLGAVASTGAATYEGNVGSWPAFFRQAAPGYLNAVDGWVRTNLGANPSPSEPRWARAGAGWNVGTPAFIFTPTNGDNCTYTSTVNGTNAYVWYFDDASGCTFTISMNGAAAGAGFATVTQAGPVGWKRAAPAGGFAATNNMKITKTNALGNLYVFAGIIYGSNQLLIHNISHDGGTAAGVGNNSWTDASAVSTPWSAGIAPNLLPVTKANLDAVIITLSANDAKNGLGNLAATKTALQTLISNFLPNSSAFLAAEQSLAVPTYFTDATWQAYVSMQYDLADTNGIPLIDHRNLVGNYAATVAAGYVIDSAGHFVPAANAQLGRAVANAILAG